MFYNYFDYYNTWDRFILENRGNKSVNVHIVYYENMLKVKQTFFWYSLNGLH